MICPKVLVTGATGKTGNAVVRQLLEQRWPVRALVHREDMRSDALRRLGADVVLADMFDADQLAQALRGVQRLYYVPLFKPAMAQAAAAFAEAVGQAKLETIVQLSQWLSHASHPSIQTRETWQVDQMLAAIPGTDHIMINPGMFADNFLRLMDFAALLYFFPVLTADSTSAPVANEDIARVAVALLQKPEGHAGKHFRPTGPKLLSGRDMAAAVAEAVGHRVLPINVPMWMFLKASRMSGVPIHEVFNYVDYMKDHQRGAFSFAGGVTDVVERLTGFPAETFATTARRYAALPFARQTLPNRLKAFARLNFLPVYPGHDLKNYERRMRFSTPEQTKLSMDDEGWTRDHKTQMDEQGIHQPGQSMPGKTHSPSPATCLART